MRWGSAPLGYLILVTEVNSRSIDFSNARSWPQGQKLMMYRSLSICSGAILPIRIVLKAETQRWKASYLIINFLSTPLPRPFVWTILCIPPCCHNFSLRNYIFLLAINMWTNPCFVCRHVLPASSFPSIPAPPTPRIIYWMSDPFLLVFLVSEMPVSILYSGTSG